MIVSDMGRRRAIGVGAGVSATTTDSGTAPKESVSHLVNGSPGTWSRIGPRKSTPPEMARA